MQQNNCLASVRQLFFICFPFDSCIFFMIPLILMVWCHGQKNKMPNIIILEVRPYEIYRKRQTYQNNPQRRVGKQPSWRTHSGKQQFWCSILNQCSQKQNCCVSKRWAAITNKNEQDPCCLVSSEILFILSFFDFHCFVNGQWILLTDSSCSLP